MKEEIIDAYNGYCFRGEVEELIGFEEWSELKFDGTYELCEEMSMQRHMKSLYILNLKRRRSLLEIIKIFLIFTFCRDFDLLHIINSNKD